MFRSAPLLARMTFKTFPVCALEDNYMYIVQKGSNALVVDPVEPEKLVVKAKELGVSIVGALITHHHWDHAGGNKKLRELLPDAAAVPIYGGDDRIDCLNHKVDDGQKISVAGLEIRCLSTPCHTTGHVCYAIEDEDRRSVFTGDTLFIAGCGKFFEGSAAEMHKNLNETLSSLEDDTEVWVGHEYTASNLRFAANVEPGNKKVSQMLEWAVQCKKEGKPTVPSTIGAEKEVNPFMRVREAAVIANVGGGEDPVEVMRLLREAKNSFKASI